MLLAVVVIAVSGVLVSRGLYADGALFLLNILKDKGYWNYDPARSFAQIVTQSPVVLALWLGMRDIDLLVHAHSVGLIVLPLLAWLAALMLAARTPLSLPLTLAFSVSYLTTGFFAIGEFNLTYALSALCFTLLLRGELGIVASIALVLSALTLTRAYEAMLFLGPLLFLISIRRLLEDRGRDRRSTTVAIVSASFFFAAASALAAWSVLHPRDPGNLAGATNFGQVIGTAQFKYVAFMLAVYAAHRVLDRVAYQGLLVLVALIASLVYLMNAGFWSSVEVHYAFRTVSGLLLFAVLSWTSLDVLAKRAFSWLNPASPRVAARSALTVYSLFIGLGTAFLVNTFQFGAWVRSFESSAIEATRWVPFDDTDVYAGGGVYDRFSWPWANPTLSLILRGDNRAGILNHSEYEGWQPFEPETMPTDPMAPYSRRRFSSDR
ncbi:MAG TPA: hypothetical protein VGE10_13585 [Zeimonas sp.]